MAGDFEHICLTPIDHIIAQLYLPYLLHFNTADSPAALHTLGNGLKRLISLLPWLAGDVVLQSDPEGLHRRMYIVPPLIAVQDVALLQVKHFDSDEDLRTQPAQAFLPGPSFIPASQQRPVVRFQANVSPNRIILAMSFMHNVFDATGAGVILQALAECCKAGENNSADMSLTKTIAAEDAKLRQEVSAWPSKCKMRLDHSTEFGLSEVDPSIPAKQWREKEVQNLPSLEVRRVTFNQQKLAEMKEICSRLLPQLQNSTFISSNDIISATLGICLDRLLCPERANKTKSATIYMIACLRSRVNPPIPDTYSGNLIHAISNNIYCSQTVDQAAENTDLLHLAELALQLRTKLSSLDETFAYSASAHIADREDWTQVEGKPADVIVSSWRHLKVFGQDFGAGLGHIEDFECGLVLVPGSCFLMPARTRDEDGESTVSWEVDITLKPGDYETLAKDPLFSRLTD